MKNNIPEKLANEFVPIRFEDASDSSEGLLYFEVLDSAKIDTQHRRKRQYVIDRMLGTSGVGIFFGESGIGKSFIVLTILFATVFRPIADHLGINYFPEKKAVMLIGEGDEGQPDRIRGISAIYNDGYPIPNVEIIKLNRTLDSSVGVKRATEAIRRVVGNSGISMIAVDTLRTFTSGNENLQPDMTKMIASLKELSTTFNCLVLPTHHPIKTIDPTSPKANAMSGSGVLRANVNDIIYVEKTGGEVFLSSEKCRDAKPAPPMRVVLSEVELARAVDAEEGDEPETTLVVTAMEKDTAVEISSVAAKVTKLDDHLRTLGDVIRGCGKMDDTWHFNRVDGQRWLQDKEGWVYDHAANFFRTSEGRPLKKLEAAGYVSIDSDGEITITDTGLKRVSELWKESH